MTQPGTGRKNLWLPWLAIVLAAALTVLTLNRYIRDADEAYQILNAQDWHNAPFAPLSAWVGHIWGGWFGYGWLPMRVLSMILNLAAIAAGGYGCRLLFRNTRLSLWLTAGAITLYALTNDHEQKYDWDTFAYFSLTIVAVMTLAYSRKPRAWLAAAIGAMAATGTMMRLPSAPILLVPPLTILLYDPERKGGKGKDLLAYLLGAAATLLALITALYGSPSGMARAIEANSIEEHSATIIVKIFIHSSARMAFYAAILTASFYLIFKASERNRRARIAVYALAFAVVLAGAMLIASNKDQYDYPYIGLMVFSILAGIVFSRKNRRSGMAADMALLLLCGLAAISGSNCGFNRMIVYPFIPIVAAYVIKEWPLWARRAETVAFIAMTISMLTLEVANLRVYIDGFDGQKYATYDAPKAKGVYFDACDTVWFAEVIPLIERYKGRNEGEVQVLSEYVDGFIIEYLTDTPNPVTRHDWRYRTLRQEQPETVRAAIARTESAPDGSVLILVLSPAFDWSERRDFSAFDDRFDRIEEGRHYIVFSKRQQHIRPAESPD